VDNAVDLEYITSSKVIPARGLRQT
jgi:hypothetical protein